MHKEICKTLALGSLIRGYFHNLKGTLQSLSLQTQILYMKKDLLISPQAHPTLEKIIQLLEKLQKQIDVALDEASNEDQGPWDLKDIMERELLFWEANLSFKHKVKKEIIEAEKTHLSYPLNEIRGILCFLEEKLYPSLKEGSELRIVVGNPSFGLSFEITPPLEEETLSPFHNLKEYIDALADLEITPSKISLQFKIS